MSAWEQPSIDLTMWGYGVDVAHIPTDAATIATAGYGGMWAGEVNNIDVITQLCLAGVGSDSMTLGAFVAAFTRSPTMLTMTFATLAKAFPGRVVLALGASSKLIVEQWSGVPFERPYSRVRDVLRFMRRALAGERMTDDFETFHARGFRLAELPAVPPALMVAGVQPRMIQLGLDEGDGVILNWASARDIDHMPELAERRHGVGTMAYVCPSSDPSVVRAAAAPLMTDYLSVPGYAAGQRRLGRGDALAPMWERFAAGDRAGAQEAFPQSVIEELVMWGTPSECLARVQEFVTAGVRPVLTFLGGDQYACAPRLLSAAPTWS